MLWVGDQTSGEGWKSSRVGRGYTCLLLALTFRVSTTGPDGKLQPLECSSRMFKEDTLAYRADYIQYTQSNICYPASVCGHLTLERTLETALFSSERYALTTRASVGKFVDLSRVSIIDCGITCAESTISFHPPPPN